MGDTNTLVKSCMLGDRGACRELFKIQLNAASSDFKLQDDKKHPNKMPFKGVLLLVDQASTKPPHGSRGHKIYVPKEVAKRLVSGLIGMGVNYDPGSMSGHAPRHKVGVITKALVSGNKVKVAGWIYKKDFPEAERDLKKPGLGMSMELADVYVRDQNEDIWHLEDFVFTGATILKKDSAAYVNTSLAAKAANERSKGEEMKKGNRNVAANSGGTVSVNMDELVAGLSQALKPVVKGIRLQGEAINAMSERLEEVGGALMVQAGADDDDDDDNHATRNTRGKKTVVFASDGNDDDDDDDDIVASGDDDDDDEDDGIHAARGSSKSKNQDDDGNDDENDDDEDDIDSASRSRGKSKSTKAAAQAKPGDTQKKVAAALEDLDDEDDDVYPEPGAVGSKIKNKGNKTTTTNVGAATLTKNEPHKPDLAKYKLGEDVKSSAERFNISAATEVIRRKTRANKKLRGMLIEIAAAHDGQVALNKKFRRRLDTMQASLERYADQEDRRTVIPVHLQNLAAKSNIDLREMAQNGTKLSVEQVDMMFAAAKQQGIDIEPSQRMAWKNQLTQSGLMDQGVIERVM